jgi:hypothetical protein
MKTSWSLLIALTSAVSLSANQNATPTPQPQGVTTQPKKWITPPVAPMVRHGADLFFNVDFIWWKSTMTNLEYAFSGINDGVVVSPTSNVSKGHRKSPNFSFEPGFKVGMGLHLAHDGWDVFGEYTRLCGHKKNQITAKPGKGLGSMITTVFANGDYFAPTLSRASSRWRQHFNVLDLELGRNFFISRYLTLRPNFGLKFSWIEQKLRLDLKVPSINLPTTGFDIDLEQEMWGMGLRGGLDTVWHFNRNWGLYADIAFAALWGFIETKHDQVAETTVGDFKTLDTREEIQEIINVVELGAGLSYMVWFNKERYQLTLQAGWEEQVWINFNQFTTVNTLRPGNLNFQGLTVKALFAF